MSRRFSHSDPGPPNDRNRGQLVLVTAATVAVALLAVMVAYAQLGYAGDQRAEVAVESPASDAVAALERIAFAVADDRQGQYAWAGRERVAADVAARFDRRADRLGTDRLSEGIVHDVDRNQTVAERYAATACPDGEGRSFGPCEAHRGVVLQERAGEVHVVAIAVDLRTVTDDASYEGTVVLDAEVGERVELS